MKKTLVAIAALAAFGAQAQSSVTLYGVLDAGYNSFSAQNGTAAKLTQKGIGYSANDTSRWGVKAIEDIGGGMKAGVTIESTLASNPRENFSYSLTGVAAPSATDFTLAGRGQTTQVQQVGDRIMTVDLTVGAHTLNIGNQAQPTRSVAVGFQADGSNLIGNLVGNDTVLTGRIPAATYVFDAGNGFKAGGSVTMNSKLNSTTADTSKTANGYALKAEYASGPLAAAAVMSKQTTNDALTATTVTTASKLTTQVLTPIGTLAAATKNIETTASVLGVSYDLTGMAPVKVYGQYATVKVDNTLNALTDDSQRKATSLGARYMIGDSYFFAQTSSGKNRITSNATDYDWKGSSYGYKHALSKRTVAYIGAGKHEYGTTATTKAVGKETMVGMLHAF